LSILVTFGEVPVLLSRLHNEELYYLYTLPNITRVKEKIMIGAICSTDGGEDRSGAYRIMVENPEENRPLGRHRGKWKFHIKMGDQDVRRGMDWIDLAQDRDG
jgi:hypothetical protein